MSAEGMDMDKMDLDNDPEFKEFMKKNNVNKEVFDHIRARLDPCYKDMVERMKVATQMALQKAQEDAVNGNLYTCTTENQPPASKADVPTSVVKASGRSFTGEVPGTAVAQRSARGRSSAIKSSKKTATTTASTDDELKIPKGEVRLEVISSTSAHNIVGTVKFVKPLTESSKLKGQHAKIGRSTSEEYKKFGFSIQDDEVSTTHAIILRKNNKFYWKDKRSTNGSIANYVDGKREHMLPGELHQLRNGVKIELGECIIKVNFSSV